MSILFPALPDFKQESSVIKIWGKKFRKDFLIFLTKLFLLNLIGDFILFWLAYGLTNIIARSIDNFLDLPDVGAWPNLDHDLGNPCMPTEWPAFVKKTNGYSIILLLNYFISGIMAGGMVALFMIHIFANLAFQFLQKIVANDNTVKNVPIMYFLGVWLSGSALFLYREIHSWLYSADLQLTPFQFVDYCLGNQDSLSDDLQKRGLAIQDFYFGAGYGFALLISWFCLLIIPLSKCRMRELIYDTLYLLNELLNVLGILLERLTELPAKLGFTLSCAQFFSLPKSNADQNSDPEQPLLPVISSSTASPPRYGAA